jgi:hypothetical protein
VFSHARMDSFQLGLISNENQKTEMHAASTIHTYCGELNNIGLPVIGRVHFVLGEQTR